MGSAQSQEFNALPDCAALEPHCISGWLRKTLNESVGCERSLCNQLISRGLPFDSLHGRDLFSVFLALSRYFAKRANMLRNHGLRQGHRHRLHAAFKPALPILQPLNGASQVVANGLTIWPFRFADRLLQECRLGLHHRQIDHVAIECAVITPTRGQLAKRCTVTSSVCSGSTGLAIGAW